MPTGRFRVHYLLFALLILMSSCSFDFGNVPEGAQITCKDTTECPGGWVCKTTIGMCVKETDSNPPKFAFEPLVSPPFAKDSTLVTLTFESDKELFKAPEAKVRLGGAEWPMAIDSAASSGKTFVFTFTALRESLRAYDGNNAVVQVTMVDKSGNKAEGLSAGSFHIDFTSPSLTKEQVVGSPVKKTSEVNVTFTLDRAITADPVVKLGSGKLFTKKGSSGGLSFEYSYTAEEGDAPAEGAKTESVTVEAVDEAGNSVSQVLNGNVTFDYVKPGLVGDIYIDPISVTELGAVTVMFESDKELNVQGPLVKVGDITLSLYSKDGNKYIYKHIAEAADGEGTKYLYLKLTDRAGNESEFKNDSKKAVVFDFTNPTVKDAPHLNKPSGYYTKGDKVGVDFAANKEMTLDEIKVSLRTETPVDMPCTYEGKVGDYYKYQCVTQNGLTGNETPQGPANISIELSDSAGNKSFTSAGLYLDFIPPSVSPGSYVQMKSDFPNNPVFNVTAFTNGTTVVVNFSVDEDLATDSPTPYVVLCKTDGCDHKNPAQVVALSLDQSGSTGKKFRFADKVTLLAMGLDFTSKIHLVPGPGGGIRDLAGNEQTGAIEISTIKVNTFQPLSPSMANVVYRRVPWGQNDASGKFVDKNFTVLCNACQFSSAVEKILIYDSETPSSGGLIGEFQNPHNGGAFGFDPIKLNGSDRAHIYLATADSAGNISPATEIKSAEWVATMGHKVPGSTFENPNTFITNGLFNKTLNQSGFVREPAVFIETPPQQVIVGQIGKYPGWGERVDVDEKPSPRDGPAMAYDSARGKLVLFGGNLGGDETWEWDGMKWKKLNPVTKPSARYLHTMVYDNARDKVVLFGGNIGSSNTSNNETWEWDGVNWTQLNPAVNPSARYHHAMVYDNERGKVVLFGGFNGSSYLNDIWEWDGVKWVQVIPGIKPSVRSGHAMAYASTLGKVVMFGGNRGGNETWEWDGMKWTKLNPATKPSERYGHALAYDSTTGKLLLFGGYYNGLHINETWEWDGTDWKQLNPAINPSARYLHAMTYDSARGKVMLFGGHTGSYSNETWEWDGTNWTQFNPATKPSARGYHAMAYDSARGKVVLFGGGDSGISFNDETWEWDGVNWAQLSPAIKPSARSGHAMAYDSVRGKVVLFGGGDSGISFNDETWEWDGVNWAQLSPAIKPSARHYHAIAYDGTCEKVVLFGGQDSTGRRDDTWEWDGESWIQVNPATKPTANYSYTLAYDNARGKTVMFGGALINSNETWEWDGTNWTQLNPATKPTARQGHAMAYYSARGKVVMFGGMVNDETWEWDGVTWMQQNPSTMPSARYAHAMAYDSVRGKVVLFGGRSVGTYNNDTWEWDGQGKGRAGQVANVAIQATGVFKDDSKPQVQQIAAKFVSGGSGYPWDDVNKKVNTTHGVDLMAWYDNEWHSLASNGDSAAAPGLVEWSTTDPVMVDKLYFGGGMKYNFAVVPIAPNGFGDPDCVDPATNHCDMGQVSTEYMEVTVKYVLP